MTIGDCQFLAFVSLFCWWLGLFSISFFRQISLETTHCGANVSCAANSPSDHASEDKNWTWAWTSAFCVWLSQDYWHQCCHLLMVLHNSCCESKWQPVLFCLSWSNTEERDQSTMLKRFLTCKEYNTVVCQHMVEQEDVVIRLVLRMTFQHHCSNTS